MSCCNDTGGLRGDVVVHMTGYGGSKDCDCCGAPAFHTKMDSRLAPFITVQEYDKCITQCNQKVFKQFANKLPNR